MDINSSIKVTNVYILSKVGDNGIASSKPKYPTIGDKVNLYAIIKAKEDEKTVYFSELQEVTVQGNKISKEKIKKWDKTTYGNIAINWSKVEPTQRILSNTFPVWHWAKVKYSETPIRSTGWSIRADLNPTYLTPQKGLGTMRFKIDVKYGRHKLSTPGKKSYGKTGIKDDVHRISMRGNTGIPIIDWGYSFMNQPYIWGSASPTRKDKDHQSEKHIGADCADLVVAAARKAGHKISYGGSHNISPNDVRKDTIFISRRPKSHTDGIYRKNKKQIKIGKDNVRLGDIVLWKGHVGILSKDRPPVGYLSSNDLVLHTLFKEPAEEPISEIYKPKFSIVRFNK